jgi:hypothetical protein
MRKWSSTPVLLSIVVACQHGGIQMSPPNSVRTQAGPGGATKAASEAGAARAPGGVVKEELCGSCRGTCWGGRCLEILAAGENSPGPISVRGGSACWGAFTEVKCVPTSGGAPVTLASKQEHPRAIAVDAASVYWANYGNGNIVKASLRDAEERILAEGPASPWAITIDATSVYWTTSNGVFKAPLDGGKITQLAAGAADGIAVDHANVYWTTRTTVMRLPLIGGTAQTFASEGGPAIAVDESKIYWLNGWGNECSASAPCPSEGAGKVSAMPFSGGVVTTLASPVWMPRSLAVDGSDVYWLDGGTLSKVAIGGGTSTTLDSTGRTQGFAVDEESLYWTAFGGTVMKLSPK